MIDDNIFAYTAGYLDGDGCFSLGKFQSENRTRYRAQIIIISTDKKVLEFFKQTYGGLVTTQKKARENYKEIYRYSTQGEKAHFICKGTIPFLIEKRKQAELFCEFAETSNRNKKQLLIDQSSQIKDIGNLVCKEDVEIVNSITQSRDIKITDYAYLAGFIDAECSLGISRYKPKDGKHPNYTYKILLQCNNTRLPCFKWLKEKFGGFICFVDKKRFDIRCNQQLTWRLGSKTLSLLLPHILPFLKHKKPVCEELIKFYETTVPLNRISRNSKKFTEFYAKIIEEREVICNKIHVLNQKGVKKL